ncbi:hypothetical protein FSP39_012796 [Pinctada imbricata]|uniref:Uncharacterized protein n=1 Tax=Pinctada imbricata TaxID=66713 RepID=A0AA88XG00_PINIB|nr:hypothetical protein FSP39_012796 [Pinctada imbricata]
MITLDGPTFASAVHGSEYQFAFRNIQRNDDVPCAVCRVTGANTVLMVPGKVDCHKDWKKQYSGLLTANHEGHPGTSEYACVDEHPEGIEGTRTHDDEGKLFYPARSICGSLPCPPYVNKGFLSCVVCTR